MWSARTSYRSASQSEIFLKPPNISQITSRRPSHTTDRRSFVSSKRPPYKPPSVFTPFQRRLTDERARDVSDTRRLYDAVHRQYRKSRWSRDDAIDRVNTSIAEGVGKTVNLPDN